MSDILYNDTIYSTTRAPVLKRQLVTGLRHRSWATLYLLMAP